MSARLIELEFLPGLRSFVAAEVKGLLGGATPHREDGPAREEALMLTWGGPLASLHSLRTVVAAYSVLHYPVPRPKALLGHQHFHRLIDEIRHIRGLHPVEEFQSFRISAAGRDSSVLRRLAADLADHTGLLESEEEGDLFLRLRPARGDQTGWQVLIRTTPRPLGARGWRVADMRGALHATLAAAMIQLSEPAPSDRFFNLMCGSGTLLIERLLSGTPAQAAGGCDISQEALELARLNVEAADLASQIDLFEADATALELPDACLDKLVCDLPWGQLLGRIERAASVYPAFLAEAYRIAEPGARLIVITHALEAFEEALRQQAEAWQLQQTFKVYQGGLHPRIYQLRKR